MVRATSLLFMLLLFAAVAEVRANSKNNLIRKRRDWVLPPRALKENTDYTREEAIAKIRSDVQSEKSIRYSLEGIGANRYPFHVFVVDHLTGNVRVTKILDREEVAMYNLSGVAKFLNGSLAEQSIDLRIKVEDDNDNAPVFGEIAPGSVYELSPIGTPVMTVQATDLDEPGNINSIIRYSLLEQTPSHDMFEMHKDGTIYVKKATLDREV